MLGVNKNMRAYRGVCMLFLVFLLAPMEDGCKYDKAAASAVQNVAVPAARPVVQLAKGK